MKPEPLKGKIGRKRFVGDELTGAMDGFFGGRHINKNSITSFLMKLFKKTEVILCV